MIVMKLRKLAEAATQGKWYTVDSPFGVGTWLNAGSETGQPFNFVCDCEMPLYSEQVHPEQVEKSLENATFIAAANPQTVLSLLDEIERLEHRVKMADTYIEKTPCDPDITAEQYEAYQSYLKTKQAPLDAEAVAVIGERE